MDFSRYTIAVGLFLLVGLMGIVLYGGNGNLDHTLDFGLFRCLMEFSFGIVMYQLYRRVLGSKSILASDLFFYSVTITILYLIHSNANDVLVVCLLGLLIVSASLNNGVPYKILKTKILRFFGDTSYSLYLLQTFWILSWAIWYDLYWKVNHPGVLPSTELILFWLFGIFVCLVLSAKFLHTVVEVGVRDKLRNLF